jgi:hypothetical protein
MAPHLPVLVQTSSPIPAVPQPLLQSQMQPQPQPQPSQQPLQPQQFQQTTPGFNAQAQTVSPMPTGGFVSNSPVLPAYSPGGYQYQAMNGDANVAYSGGQTSGVVYAQNTTGHGQGQG